MDLANKQRLFAFLRIELTVLFLDLLLKHKNNPLSTSMFCTEIWSRRSKLKFTWCREELEILDIATNGMYGPKENPDFWDQARIASKAESMLNWYPAKPWIAVIPFTAELITETLNDMPDYIPECHDVLKRMFEPERSFWIFISTK